MPGVGFAMGLERILLALDSLENKQLQANKMDVFLAMMDEQYETQAIKILSRIRQAGIKADKDYNGRSAKAQMKYADKLGARIVLLLGEDEVRQGTITVRNMETKAQSQIQQDVLIEAIKVILEAKPE